MIQTEQSTATQPGSVRHPRDKDGNDVILFLLPRNRPPRGRRPLDGSRRAKEKYMSQGVLVTRAEGRPLLGASYLTSGEAKEAGRRKAPVRRQGLGYDGKGESGGRGTRPDHRGPQVSQGRGFLPSWPGAPAVNAGCRYRS